MQPEDIIKMVIDSGLRGRGGAGFSAGQKWSFIPKEKKGPHYLAVNADESEPGTFKDRYLIDYDPHSMLEGIAIACQATQCDIAYIYIRGEYHHQAKVLERAIKEAYDHRIFGPQGMLRERLQAGVLRPPRRGRVHLRRRNRTAGEPGRQARLAAQQAAVPGDRRRVCQADGHQQRRDALPGARRSSSAARTGSKSMGTKSSPGPKLYGMSGHVNKPGVYEDELGITLDYAINELAGGMKGGAYKAAICGGISMGVLGPNQLDIKLDFDDVRFRGGCLGLGTAGMIVMNEHTDMVAALRNCVRFYAHESAASARRAARAPAGCTRSSTASWTAWAGPRTWTC